jgi:two-component system CheB/CheR fusion protein
VTALDSVEDAVAVVDAAGNTLHANVAFARLMADIERSGPPLDGDGNPVDVEVMWRRGAARPDDTDDQLVVPGRAGAQRSFRVTIRPIRPPGPDGAAAIVALHDVSERQLRLRGEQFIGHLGHELRTPLSGLQCYAELLETYLDDDLASPEARAAVRRVRALAQRLVTMIQDVFDVARITSERLSIVKEMTDLRTVVAAAVEIVESLPGCPPVYVCAPAEAIMVHADARRLGDVLRNLLTNAVKHASGTERIDVRLRLDREGAAVEVEDYGPGIPPAELPHIFTRHHQVPRDGAASADGLGLGLFIAQTYVVAHGGRIEVVSALGSGTRFTVVLPRERSGTRRKGQKTSTGSRG